MNIIIVIGIVIFLLYIFLHIRLNIKSNNDYEILQSKNPDKENFEKILIQKSISIFTEISSKWNIDINDKESLKKNLKEYMSYYNSPLSINNNLELIKNKKNNKMELTIEQENRHLILQLSGKRKYIFFNPLQKKFLYFKNKKFEVSYWNLDTKKYPLVNESKFIEVILHPEQMIYIPKFWIYCYIDLEESITVSYKSKTLLSLLC